MIATTIRALRVSRQRVRMRIKWRQITSVQDCLLSSISHAYLLFAVALGHELDESLPVVDLAALQSHQVVAKIGPRDAPMVLQTAFAHLDMAHKFAMELERMVGEYEEASAALLALIERQPDQPPRHRLLARKPHGLPRQRCRETGIE